MGMFQHKYLSYRMLKGLAAYKYKACGYTWLDDLHNPMWNWIVENLFPLWLAPNLVTLSGLMFMIASHILLCIYAPTMKGEDAPSWVHIFSGFSLIVYVNLDCMDGKQARRTKTSSPLGQLFDHGCDALVTGLLIVNVGTSVSLEPSPQGSMMIFAPMFLWILGQWEEYHTGMMTYGNGFFGILEANYALASVHLISGIVGVAFWQKPLSALLPIVPAAIADVSMLWALFSVGFVGIIIQSCGQVYRVFASEQAMDAQERGHKELGPLNAIKHLLYFVIFFSLAFIFISQPPNGAQFHTRALLTYYTISYATIATQIIMAHMAKEAYVPAAMPFVGLVVGIANWKVGLIPGEMLTYGLAIIVVLAYLHYVINVCDQVCEYLQIRCLVIPTRPKE